MKFSIFVTICVLITYQLFTAVKVLDRVCLFGCLAAAPKI